MRAKQVFIMWGTAVLFALATYQPAVAKVLAVFFEDVGAGTAMTYAFTVDSQTGAPIGYRAVWYPQGFQNVTSFAWALHGNVLTLDFAATRDVIALTEYDPNIDVQFFTPRFPSYYWAGCHSPYIPRGLPSWVARQVCSLVGH